MHSLEFLKNINNKEILNEILHNSIDFLIENKNEEQTLKLCHKYGFNSFNSPDEFLLSTRTIGKHYRNACTENLITEAEVLAEFGSIASPELQKLITPVLSARRSEILRYLIRKQNSQEHTLVESFDWDLRYVMGDSSLAHNHRRLATCTFNCLNKDGKKSVLHFQMDKQMLKTIISELETAAEAIDKELEDNV